MSGFAAPGLVPRSVRHRSGRCGLRQALARYSWASRSGRRLARVLAKTQPARDRTYLRLAALRAGKTPPPARVRGRIGRELTVTIATQAEKRADYKVADLSLADFCRTELTPPEHDMAGL